MLHNGTYEFVTYEIVYETFVLVTHYFVDVPWAYEYDVDRCGKSVKECKQTIMTKLR